MCSSKSSEGAALQRQHNANANTNGNGPSTRSKTKVRGTSPPASPDGRFDYNAPLLTPPKPATTDPVRLAKREASKQRVKEFERVEKHAKGWRLSKVKYVADDHKQHAKADFPALFPTYVPPVDPNLKLRAKRPEPDSVTEAEKPAAKKHKASSGAATKRTRITLDDILSDPIEPAEPEASARPGTPEVQAAVKAAVFTGPVTPATGKGKAKAVNAAISAASFPATPFTPYTGKGKSKAVDPPVTPAVASVTPATPSTAGRPKAKATPRLTKAGVPVKEAKSVVAKEYISTPSHRGTSNEKPPNAELDVPWQCANPECAFGLTWYPRDKTENGIPMGRKVISQFFGRNKAPTKLIPNEVWHYFCRKDYQRTKYSVDAKGEKRSCLWVIEVLRDQLYRLQQWRPDAIFKVQLVKAALDRYNAYLAELRKNGNDSEAAAEAITKAKKNKNGKDIKGTAEASFPPALLEHFQTHFAQADVDYAGLETILEWLTGEIEAGHTAYLAPMEFLINDIAAGETVNDVSGNYDNWLAHKHGTQTPVQQQPVASSSSTVTEAADEEVVAGPSSTNTNCITTAKQAEELEYLDESALAEYVSDSEETEPKKTKSKAKEPKVKEPKLKVEDTEDAEMTDVEDVDDADMTDVDDAAEEADNADDELDDEDEEEEDEDAAYAAQRARDRADYEIFKALIQLGNPHRHI